MTVSGAYLHVNALKPAAAAFRDSLARALAAHGIEERPAEEADVVIALGGDGTILKAVHEHAGKPVLGLNFGGLGYLSSVEKKDFEKAVSMLAEGRFRISRRVMLSVSKEGGEESVALNDVVLVREMSGSAAILDLEVDGRAATRYLADGLVVATPTGSTAYSLSAGGPVLMPDSRSIVVTPMSPHALGVRPMVVGDSVRLAVRPRSRADGRAGEIGVYADGAAAFRLGAGEAATICKASASAAMVELAGYDPYEVLARKLGWSGTYVH